MTRTTDRRRALQRLLGLAAAPAWPSFAAESPTVATAFEGAMRDWLLRHRVRNASFALMHDDRLVSAQGHGDRGAHERVPLWSLSKAITAACVAALVREGRLGLHDRIGPLLQPVFDQHGPPADSRVARVTVAQLLSHRAGWPGTRNFAPGFVPLLQQVPLAEARASMLMPAVLATALARDPGTRFEYSNTGYLLLGQVIEAVTGGSYADVCQRLVLAPAGIEQATMDRLWGRLLHAAGGWSMSAPEYLAFLRLLRPRRPDFLSAPVRDWMTDGRHETHEMFGGPGFAYTLGMHLRQRTGDLFHAGAWSWRKDGPDGPAVRQGTWAGLASDGTGFVATFDTISPAHDIAAGAELDALVWRLQRAGGSYPTIDLFEAAGVGPLRLRP
jgi:CubicO group peptidase (beta-lactamase class C family)